MTSVIRGSDNFDSSPSLRSRVRVRSANGFGSTNTAVRRWSTIVENVGSDITYADSATLGGSFAINVDGIYSVYFSDQFTTATTIIITNSGNNLAGNATAADILSVNTSGAAAFAASTSWTGFLPAGSVIRGRTNSPGSASGSNPHLEHFGIVRVA